MSQKPRTPDIQLAEITPLSQPMPTHTAQQPTVSPTQTTTISIQQQQQAAKQQIDAIPTLRHMRPGLLLQSASAAEYSYKTVFAVLAVANHIWGIAEYGGDVHRYLTYISSLVTAVAKILSLAELLVTVQLKTLPEHHWSREVVNYFQVLTSVLESIVFSFYWTVLAEKTYRTAGLDAADHVLNITMHVMCPIIAVTPIFLERTDFRTKQLVGVYVAGFIYLGYMVSYAVRTNKGIYDPLFTFRDVITYVLVAVVLLLILGFFFLLKWVNKKMVEKFLQKNPPTPAQQ